MKRLEIIHLRSAGQPIDSLGDRIKRSIGDREPDAPVAALLRRRGLETDLAIHIHSDPGSEAAAYQIALQLA